MPNWSRPEFDWDDGNESHLIERHDVYSEEAEQSFSTVHTYGAPGMCMLSTGATIPGVISSSSAFCVARPFASFLPIR